MHALVRKSSFSKAQGLRETGSWCKLYFSKAHRQQTQTSRDSIRDLIKQTSICDGTNTSAVRTWIKEINLADNQVGDAYIIQIITNTISSSLRFEIECFIDDYVGTNNTNRTNVPWPLVRDHVTNQFFNINELQALRDEHVSPH